MVEICPGSYLPEHAFDQVGYCGGQPEPILPTPPRAGCGCGPLLLACLPPEDEQPKLLAQIGSSLANEVVETTVDLVEHRRPFDELLTTSRTFQDGLVEFFYLRRQLIAELATRPYSPALEQELLKRVQALRLDTAGRFVERGGIYRGTGVLFATPAAGAIFATYRTTVRDGLFLQFLCTEFASVHVDSEVLLKAVGAQHGNLRALGAIGDSPMRKQVGCKGCHAPMDSAAAFLTDFATSLFGSYPLGKRAAGQLIIHGADDLRGEGDGIAQLTRLVVRQPEFAECVVERTFSTVFHRRPLASERPRIAAWVGQFEEQHRDWAWLLRTIVIAAASLPSAGTL